MANHKSAKKCMRHAARRTIINKARKSRIRTFIRKFEDTVHVSKTKTFDPVAAQEALIVAESEIMRGAHKGTLHKNTASRKVSRLTKRFKALAAS